MQFSTKILVALVACTSCIAAPTTCYAAVIGLGQPVTIAPLTPPPPDGLAAQSYAADFHVGVDEARRRLSTQQHGGDIVHQLRDALGSSYGGVWFDNTLGRYHINIAGSSPQSPAVTRASATTDRLMTTLGLTGETDTRVVNTRWDDLVSAQANIDRDLADVALAGRLTTAPDPVTSKLNLYVSSAVTAAEHARIQAAAAAQNVPTLEIARPAADLSVRGAACTFPNCDTLEGGTRITNADGSSCSDGYLAKSNTAPFHFYAVTAGHCARPNASWHYFDRGWNARPLGAMNRVVFGVNGDYAGIDITGSGVYPPDSAFWGINLYYPTYYAGWAVSGEFGCRTGSVTPQAQCGAIGLPGQTINIDGTLVHGEFDVAACANKGDSGGPYMMNYYAVGITSAIPQLSDGTFVTCGFAGATSYYSEVMNAVNPANLNVTIQAQG